MANYEATTPSHTTDDFPGKTLGIVGLVLAIFMPVVGIIISAIALNQSKSAGFENKLAKIGVILGIVLTILGVIGSIAYVAFIGSVVGAGGY